MPNHQEKTRRFMNNKTLRRITDNAIIAAVYIALTIAFGNLCYSAIQFRIAEILILFVYFRKDFTIGITIGCAIANIFSPLGYIDVIFGTLATLLSCIFIIILPKIYLAIIPPLVFNAFIVGAELYFIEKLPFWMNVLYVAVGEFVVLLFGLMICLVLMKNPRFLEIIQAERPKINEAKE